MRPRDRPGGRPASGWGASDCSGAGALVAALALLLLGGCRFEKRPELQSTGAPEPAAEEFWGGKAAQDSVRQVVEAFEEALRLGDLTRVSQLTTAGALLLDQEEHIRWSRGAPDQGLPRPLLDSRVGLGWKLLDSYISPLGDGVVLIVNRFHATVSGEDVPWTAVESLVLVRTAQGWRIRYLHRSRGLGAPDEGP